MNPVSRASHCALGLFRACQPCRAQTSTVSAAPGATDPSIPATNVKKEMNDLVRADAQAVVAAGKSRPGVAARPGASAVMLDPYIVRSERTIVLPPYETPMARFLETGEIPLHIGKKNSIGLSVGPPSSLPMAGPNGRGGAGIAQIAIHFSW